ncbi:MAG: UDP-N-acetylmuramoyl-tripeptide--D-alanyl-D-alanine ligase [Clostridiales bacterium]|nr:UDP-N-acetylmuramoyl-tripeptide--D-alanyl-D-alanine ligase [Clostridiales bacterium]
MAELRLKEIAARVNGRIIQGDPALVFAQFNIDSRLSQPGELFFALRARRDGHDFIPDAAARGARGAVISREVQSPGQNFALVRVEDTAVALQRLAGSVLADHPVKVVGITGSVGKTTTKEFAASLLARRFNVLKSEGNYNNHIGLALSLLRLNPSYDVAVLEMAMSGRGEIRTLTRIAPPDVSVVINVNPVHLEFLHSLEEIALAKKEILEGTKPGGTAVVNADDPWVRTISQDWKGQKITFGLSPRCDVRATRIRKKGTDGMVIKLHLGREKEEVLFPFVYDDYLYNLLAAVSANHALFLPFDDIIQMIPQLKPFSRRGEIFRLASSIELVDDSYNSNPKALASVLRSLASLPARRRVAVLGDMLELGEKEIEFHIEAGEEVVACGWDVLITVGRLSLHLAESAQAAGLDPCRIFSFASSEEAAARMTSIIQTGDLILVKGSRGMKMDFIADRIKSYFRED